MTEFNFGDDQTWVAGTEAEPGRWVAEHTYAVPGDYTVSARHPEAGQGETTVTVPPEGSSGIEVVVSADDITMYTTGSQGSMQNVAISSAGDGGETTSCKVDLTVPNGVNAYQAFVGLTCVMKDYPTEGTDTPVDLVAINADDLRGTLIEALNTTNPFDNRYLLEWGVESAANGTGCVVTVWDMPDGVSVGAADFQLEVEAPA